MIPHHRRHTLINVIAREAFMRCVAHSHTCRGTTYTNVCYHSGIYCPHYPLPLFPLHAHIAFISAQKRRNAQGHFKPPMMRLHTRLAFLSSQIYHVATNLLKVSLGKKDQTTVVTSISNVTGKRARLQHAIIPGVLNQGNHVSASSSAVLEANGTTHIVNASVTCPSYLS